MFSWWMISFAAMGRSFSNFAQRFTMYIKIAVWIFVNQRKIIQYSILSLEWNEKLERCTESYACRRPFRFMTSCFEAACLCFLLQLGSQCIIKARRPWAEWHPPCFADCLLLLQDMWWLTWQPCGIQASALTEGITSLRSLSLVYLVLSKTCVPCLIRRKVNPVNCGATVKLVWIER